MKRVERLHPVFISRMPAQLEPGNLYISNEYYVIKHLCACGCAEVVTLPLHPAQWRYTFDGKNVSVHPSVGNIGTPCNSHYWIVSGRVEWARPISARQAQQGWTRDGGDLLAFESQDTDSGRVTQTPARKPLWRRLWPFQGAGGPAAAPEAKAPRNVLRPRIRSGERSVVPTVLHLRRGRLGGRTQRAYSVVAAARPAGRDLRWSTTRWSVRVATAPPRCPVS